MKVPEFLVGLRRELLAWPLVATACIGFLVGKISSEQFVPLAVAVTCYYFGQRGASNGG